MKRQTLAALIASVFALAHAANKLLNQLKLRLLPLLPKLLLLLLTHKLLPRLLLQICL